MRLPNSTFVTVFLIILLIGASMPATSHPKPDPVETESTATNVEVQQNTTYSLTPDSPGSVTVEVVYTIPEPIEEFSFTFSSPVTVLESENIRKVSGSDAEYEWVGDSRTATATVAYDPNLTVSEAAQGSGVETVSRSVAASDHQQASEESYIFADVGEWALVNRLQISEGWRAQEGTPAEEIEVIRNADVAGSGLAGESLVYMGDIETETRTSAGQKFVLGVPAEATLNESRADILDSVTNAAKHYNVGARDERVTMIAAPTTVIEWGVLGLNVNGADMYVRDTRSVDRPDNTWVHEYIHTRETFSPTADAAWISEGTAVYYSAYYTHRQGRISYEEYREYMNRGHRRHKDAILTQPSTWDRGVQYTKGPLAVAHIDKQIREESSKKATFEQAINLLNRNTAGRDDVINQADILAAIQSPASTQLAESVIRTSDVPEMYSHDVYTGAFTDRPAVIESRSLPLLITGKNREETAEGGPVVLVRGETLTVSTSAVNTGGENGSYTSNLHINGVSVDSSTHSLSPGEIHQDKLEYTFEETGQYRLAAPDQELTVRVVEPTEPDVERLSTSATNVTTGDSVNITVTLSNPNPHPASASIPLMVNGTRFVYIAEIVQSGETLNVTYQYQTEHSGTLELTAGDATTTITVEDSLGSMLTGSSGPGFTVVGGILAFLLCVIALGGLKQRQ